MNPSRNSTPTRYLVTMALPYANGDIHLGHLVEAVQTDVFVRYQKLRGNEAVFICADDTHGTPIEFNALSRGITPRELVGQIWQRHVKDYAAFGIGFDLFYSTDSPENRRYAEHIFERLRAADMIVERAIEQYYCENDKRFLPDRFIKGSCPKCGAADQYGDVCESCGATYDPTDLADPRCHMCGGKPVLRTSTHLFVDLKKSESFLTEYLNSGVLQDDMKGFVGNWITTGLKQWCISRDGPYFGFEIPGYPGKFFYVWLDAPIGYLSSTDKWCADHGRKVEEYWRPESGARIVHFIGKDIVYFHTLFWPVMLHHAAFSTPSRFYVHGFLTVNGEKMSKSRGTFVLASTFAEKMKHPQAAQYLRFYYAAKLSGNSGDLDLNGAEFATRVNTTLANNIGNLHHRTYVFAERYFDGKVPDESWDESIATHAALAGERIAKAFEDSDYKTVVETVHALGTVGNKYYQDRAPWELLKKDPAAAAKVIVTCANLVRSLAVFLKPIVPEIAGIYEKQIGRELVWEDHVFGMRGVPVGTVSKLAEPIEPEEFAAVIEPPPAPQTALVTKPQITFEQFGAVDLRVGVVRKAERVPKSKKLLKLQVEIGGSMRQVVAGIAEHYTPEQMPGRQVVVVANLKPAVLMGQESQGMLLAASDGGKLVLVQPELPAQSGANVS